jgi:hypothetical protein
MVLNSELLKWTCRICLVNKKAFWCRGRVIISRRGICVICIGVRIFYTS